MQTTTFVCQIDETNLGETMPIRFSPIVNLVAERRSAG